MRRYVLPWMLGTMIGGIAAVGGWAADPQGRGVRFRDLVYKALDEAQPAAVAAPMGLAGKPVEFTALEYRVLHVRPDGSTVAVDPKLHRFRVGDRIKVVVRPLTDSHLYIFHVGASGRAVFLLPREDEEATVVSAKREVTLPQEGYLEFVPPPGDEMLYVIATREPVRDRELLARVITSRDPSQDTPAMAAQRRQINAVVAGALKSEAERRSERNDGTIRYRGVFENDDRRQFVADLQSRGVTWGSLELPPEKPGEGAVALGFRTAETPAGVGTALVVGIPLRSAGGSRQSSSAEVRFPFGPSLAYNWHRPEGRLMPELMPERKDR